MTKAPKPTSEQLKEAKDYILKRIAAENSMNYNLTRAVNKAAREIVALAYKYGYKKGNFRFSSNPTLKREVDAIIARLKSDIEDYAVTLAIADHKEHRDELLAWLGREDYGKTLHERIDEYTDRLVGEIELGVVSGVELDKSSLQVQNSITDNKKHPFQSALVLTAIAQLPHIIDSLGVRTSYGVGRTNSAFTALETATTHAIASAWMRNWWLTCRDNGALGYWVKRGSSYPCALCDSNVGYHTQFDKLPPFHNYCRCYFVPVYPEESLADEDYRVYTHGKGTVKVHKLVSEADNDYTKLVSIAEHFANGGSTVELTPKMTRPPKFEYKSVYGSLVGTKYEGKCPDLRIDGKFYEHEGFVSNDPKRAFRNMLNDGLKQSDCLIIDRPNLTDAYMKRVIWQRVKDGQNIAEIWVNDGGKFNILYKKSEE